MESGNITIRRTNLDVEREPLLQPFGFKGAYVSELWQIIALLESEGGHQAVGLANQSVLWSDADVFAAHTPVGGNALMLAITERALQLAGGVSFRDPVDLLDKLLPQVYAYAKQITGKPNLRKTFALNALVAVDHAAWLLYAQERGIRSFDEMIPEAYRAALSYRHERVAAIPVVGYGMPVEEIAQAATQDSFCFKVKLGQPGSQEEMLEKDKQRLEAVHQVLGPLTTAYTEDGRIPYYFDANGRYERKDTLLRLLDHADKIGALSQIAIIEEPFPEEFKEEVGDIGVRFAADESAHTDEDTRERISLGYGAIALKPVAKTLSMTLKIAQVAHEHHVPCLCADLTVNPILVDWNKMVAAHLEPFPGFKLGLLETNGHQNYRNWETMVGHHPHAGASWMRMEGGTFRLDRDFYEQSGGILDLPQYYLDLVRT